MSDFEDKLNSILSNSEAMGQIMQLARSLGDNKREASDNDSPPPPPPSAPEAVPPAPEFNPFSSLGDLDPRLLDMIFKVMSAYQSNDDDRAALLSALRPFVRPERYARLDQAIQISKLTRVIRIALDSFRNKDGGGNHGSHVS